jgi:two-component system, response regulator FlrC
MTENQKKKILVVDDEQHQLDTVCRGLFLYGYDCEGAQSVADAIAALDRPGGDPFDLVLTDLTMPGGSGLDLIKQVRKNHPDLAIVVITGLAATDEIDLVRELQIPLLSKPFEPGTLVDILEKTLASA